MQLYQNTPGDFTSRASCNLHSRPWEVGNAKPPATQEKTEAQAREVTCPPMNGKAGTELSPYSTPALDFCPYTSSVTTVLPATSGAKETPDEELQATEADAGASSD